ncbi:hypothetical protein Btru_034415 [Bulinus truncatus]|nr:hypothetical protein Btru_034415 [Bulinus truncatus]
MAGWTEVFSLVFLLNIPAGYDSQGATIAGYDSQGATVAGYVSHGATIAGYDSQGATIAGYDSQGATIAGYVSHGATIAGYVSQGAIIAGYDSQGATIAGYDSQGATIAGYDSQNGRVALKFTIHDIYPSNEEGLFAPSCSKGKGVTDTESRSIQQVSQLKGIYKTNIEEGGKDQTNLEDLTSSFIGIKDGKANSDLLESASSCSCKDSIRANSHSDVVTSDESSKTLSPLFKNVCPICGKNFKQEDIEEHASACGEEYKDPNLKRCNFCNCEMTADILDEHETKCSIRNKKRSVPSRLTRSLKGTSPLQKAPEPLLFSDSEDDGELIIEVESGTQKRIM